MRDEVARVAGGLRQLGVFKMKVPVEYKGAKIGFCCPKCGDKFDALDDAGKVAALAKVGTKLP